MKTAINLLKFIAIMLTLAWLASCGGHVREVRLIHAYGDSIGIARSKIIAIRRREDSIYNSYSEKYPATAFDFTTAGARARAQWLAKERAAYHEMLDAKAAHIKQTALQKIMLEIDCVCYKAKIDSLKIELYK